LLIEIGGYNGEADDDAVTVAVFAAEGMREKGCPSSVDASAGYFTPGWCGLDRWLVAKDSFVTTSIPRVLASGYVTQHRLVAKFANRVALPFSETSSVAVDRGTLEGRLVALDENMQPRDAGSAPTPAQLGSWRFEGVLAGRSSTGDVLTGLGAFQLGDTPLCKSAFAAVRSIICNAADLSLSQDHTGADCDALSAAVGLVADPALRGGLDQDAGVPQNECTPGNVDAAEYRCAP
jgi:hypothetical protein